MSPDAIEDAITEAKRRLAISDRDVVASVEHFVTSVRKVCHDWRLTAEQWLNGGVGTPTLAVTREDGTPGVLKIAEPGRLDTAARVMVAADGHGYARVLAWDSSRGALLTERLGQALWMEASTVTRQAQLIVPLLRDAWRVSLDCGSPFVGKASELLGILTELGPRYGHQHPDVLAQATRYAKELAASERPEIVCHGDPHAGNVLRSGQGWALIDPDGFVGERAYDLGVVLRDACGEIVEAEESEPGSGVTLLREQCRRLAELADADPERVWRWAFVERVTTALYLRWHGYGDESATFLQTAAILAR